MSERIALFGVDHPRFGPHTWLCTAAGRGAVAIAAGSDPALVRWGSKGDPAIPNEDACCVVDAGDRALIAVADAHFGHEASHVVIRALVEAEVPRSIEELEFRLRALATGPAAGSGSETTLVVAVLERSSGTGFGVCYGDSTVATVAERGVDVWSVPGTDFVTPGDEATWADGRRFLHHTPAGALLVAFSDGVDGCGGRRGAGIGRGELVELFTRAGGCDAERFVADLARLALAGVGGSRGGFDNLAIAAAS